MFKIESTKNKLQEKMKWANIRAENPNQLVR